MNKSTFCLLLVLTIFCSQALFAQDDSLLKETKKKHIEAVELLKKNDEQAKEQAQKIFTENLPIWEQLKDSEKIIETLLGLTYITRIKKPQETIDYAQKIFPLADKPEYLLYKAEAYSAYCVNYRLLGDLKNSIPNCLTASTLFREISEKTDNKLLNVFNINPLKEEAGVLRNLGYAYRSNGETEKSLETNLLALKKTREANEKTTDNIDLKSEGDTLYILGQQYFEIGDYKKSIEFNDELIKVGKQLKSNLTLIYNTQAINYLRLGMYQKAIDSFQQCIASAQERNEVGMVAVAKVNMSSILISLGEYDESQEILEEVLAYFKEKKELNWQSQIYSLLGEIYFRIEKHEKALEAYQNAFNLSKAEKNNYLQGIILTHIGRSKNVIGTSEDALKVLFEALVYANESKDTRLLSYTYTEIAKAYSKDNNYEKATDYYKQSEAIDRSLETPHELVGSLYEFAKHEYRFNNKTIAIEKMKETISILENLRNSFYYEGYRSSFLSSHKKYYDFYIQLLTETAQEKPNQGFGEEALKLAESVRARSLLDTLGQNLNEIRGKIDPKLIEEEKNLHNKINAKDSTRLKAIQQKDNSKASKYEKEIAELFKKQNELKNKILQSNPQFATLTNPQPLNLQQIQEQVLDSETILLEYALGEKASYLFLVTKNNFEIFTLPNQAEIEKQVRKTLENLKARSQIVTNESVSQRTARIKKADADLEKSLAETSKILLAPIENKIQSKRLAIVSSGILQYLPFSVLKDSNNRYLIENNEIVNLPSASIVPLIRQTKKSLPTNGLAIMADPVFSFEDVRLAKIQKPENSDDASKLKLSEKVSLLRSDFSRLRFSRIEAETISSFAKKNETFVALDFSANLKAVNSENLKNSRILHFATHGIVNSQFPELSGIVLSLVDENGFAQEGFLRLHDVYNLNLSADLVVLSACETALGKEVKGEGIVGLARGFMFAGASQIAATLWRVDDKATADLMKKFYQKMMVEKLNPSSALRQAQMAMLRDKTSSHPFYWAGFTLQGDFQKTNSQK